MTRLNKKNIGTVLIGYFFATLLTGCAARVADLSIVSTQTVPLSASLSLNANSGVKASGEDCNFYFFDYYPFSNKHINLQVAIDKALKNGGGNIMVDEVTTLSNVWAVLGNIRCVHAQGVVLNTSK